jgi:quinone-modifying oxidoreductase subunit QmoC
MGSDPSATFRLPRSPEEPKAVRLQIAFQSNLDPEFAQRIARRAHGEAFMSCIQCGTCSATCPVSPYMDYTPRQIIAMIREGFKDDVLKSLTIWLCASCYACTVECPRQIRITDVMYALKREAIAEGAYPKRLPTPVLATEFFKQVEKRGRNSETWLMLALYWKTNLFQFFRDMRLGLKLMRTGRMPLTTDSVKAKHEIRSLMRGAEKAEKEFWS